MGYAFISYSSKNQTFADAMRELFKKYNIDTWMAPYDIPAGSEYAEVLYDALIGCSCLVLMLTDVSQNSQWVKKEVNIAITNGKTVIPIKLEDIELNRSMKLYLNDQQIIPVSVIEEKTIEIQNVLNSVIGITCEPLNASKCLKETQHGKTIDTLNPKKIELTVWSPVNTVVYLNDKRHLVMKIDHNTGFNYKQNSINVEGEFELIFVSKGFEKSIAFDTASIDDKLDYHLGAILSKKEIATSYDRDDAIAQLKEEPTAYAYKQLSIIGTVDDIYLLLEELNKLTSTIAKNHHTDYLIATCVSALGELALKYKKVEDVKIILKVYETYESKSSYGYMFEPILKRLKNEEFSIEANAFFHEMENAEANTVDKQHVSSELIAKEDFLDEFVDKKFQNAINDVVFADVKNDKPRGRIAVSSEDVMVTKHFKQQVTNSIDLCMPNNEVIEFEFIEKSTLNEEYLIVSRNEDSNSVVFFVFKNTEGTASPPVFISEGKKLKRIYRSFMEEHKDEYIFTDEMTMQPKIQPRKPREFAEKTATGMFGPYLPKSIKIPPIYECIESHVFKHARKSVEYTELIIPKSVKKIEAFAFCDIAVKRVIIPNSVTDIGVSAFNLTSDGFIVCDAESYAYKYAKENNLKNSVELERCNYCGGEFSGLFKKKCGLCGRRNKKLLNDKVKQ